MKRTEYCGNIRFDHIMTEQVCCGWVLTKRDIYCLTDFQSSEVTY